LGVFLDRENRASETRGESPSKNLAEAVIIILDVPKCWVEQSKPTAEPEIRNARRTVQVNDKGLFSVNLGVAAIAAEQKKCRGFAVMLINPRLHQPVGPSLLVPEIPSPIADLSMGAKSHWVAGKSRCFGVSCENMFPEFPAVEKVFQDDWKHPRRPLSPTFSRMNRVFPYPKLVHRRPL